MTLALLVVPVAEGADDPAARSLQQQQLQRQQQQEALQLRMQQQQSAAQHPPQGIRERQATEQLQIEQRQRQDALHYRQGIEPDASSPSDDAGARRAKEAIEAQKARDQGDALLRRSEAEQQN